ncbi:signal recognition particle, SRP19 subunit [Myriangium duriaei CBS 260.36]|uniref:Signal recognition particle, SRP19 subunit n=1 Tax=Myriangium duriaei CBS 260.36 TaxID=1168546 RepID=A0A9P4IRK9_9PEZI|nr:signal recognition particle, SRP19 subunit [Myriangium duriaei CBS 260.36]
MSMQPRIEEVSDSDSDPSEMDPSDFAPSSSLINPSDIPSTAQSASSMAAARQSQEAALASQRAAREKTKRYQCLYPIYFDSSRSRAEGRRVNKSDGVANPLARTIIDALQSLGMPGAQIAFEPAKMHPKDWANPGRVRIQLRDEAGRDTTGGRVRNKHELLHKVAAYLKEHPTTEDSPLRLRIPGVPVPEKEVPAVQVPRGWKMGSILPLHSPALSGGGVSEDFFKDMMKEMQGQGGAGQAKKKDKKGKK